MGGEKETPRPAEIAVRRFSMPDTRIDLPGIPDQSLRPKQLRDDPPVLRGALPRHLADPCGGDRAPEGDGKVRFEDPAAEAGRYRSDREYPHEKGAQHGERKDAGNPGEDTECSVLEHVIDFQEDRPSMPVPTAIIADALAEAAKGRFFQAAPQPVRAVRGGYDNTARRGIPKKVFFLRYRIPIWSILMFAGGVAERLKAAVLKTVAGEVPQVRIRPLRHPPSRKVRDGKS